MRKATEPTNILWENRQYSKCSRLLRAIGVTFIVLILLSIVFAFIFYGQTNVQSLEYKYQRDNCQQFE